MKAKKPDLLHTTMCDDIREEKHNKLSLIGVYQEKIIVPNFPFVFSKLCFLQSWGKGQGEFNPKIMMVAPDGGDLARLSLAKRVKLPNTDAIAAFLICFSGLRVDKPGTYSLQTFFEDSQQPAGKFDFTIEKGKVE